MPRISPRLELKQYTWVQRRNGYWFHTNYWGFSLPPHPESSRGTLLAYLSNSHAFKSTMPKPWSEVVPMSPLKETRKDLVISLTFNLSNQFNPFIDFHSFTSYYGPVCCSDRQSSDTRPKKPKFPPQLPECRHLFTKKTCHLNGCVCWASPEIWVQVSEPT